MTRRLLAWTLALLASGGIWTAASGAFELGLVPPPPGGEHASATRSVESGPFGHAVLHALNAMRARHHLPPFAGDGRMNHEASAHSHDMARRGYFAHGSWNGRVARASGRARVVGEVLAWLEPASPHGEAVWAVRAWLRSPEHRRVLLDGGFRRVGIGRAVGDERGERAAVYTVDVASAG